MLNAVAAPAVEPPLATAPMPAAVAPLASEIGHLFTDELLLIKPVTQALLCRFEIQSLFDLLGFPIKHDALGLRLGDVVFERVDDVQIT